MKTKIVNLLKYGSNYSKHGVDSLIPYLGIVKTFSYENAKKGPFHYFFFHV